MPPPECIDLGLSSTKGLAHLHAAGLLHRDIKPSNIIFVNGRPKLADIGLVTESSEARSLVGTEGFIPPEGPTSPQADIYSLGKVLYEISMGKDRQDFPEPATQLWEAPEAESMLELNAVILKAAANDRRQRYLTADDMLADLELLERGKSVRRLRAARRWLRLFEKAGVAALLLAIAVWGGNSWLQYRLEQLQHRPGASAGRLAGRVPPRDTRATRVEIDLAAYYNTLLDEWWFGPEGNTLAAIPRGLGQFGGVEFDVRGLLQLASPEVRSGPGGEYPQTVTGIGIDEKCDRLHFLQGTVSGAGEGQEIGRYIVRYANGARQIIPIRYGIEVRDCWSWTGGHSETTNGVVAWRGQNPATRERGFALQVYRMTWQNPFPDLRIASLDFASGGSASAPFLLAITAEPHLSGNETGEPNLLERIQAQAASYQRVRASERFGQPDFQRVQLNARQRRSGLFGA